MNIKIISIIILVMATNWFSYSAGVDKERAADANLLANQKKKVSELVNKLEIEKAKKKVITHEKIIKIKQATSKCADTIIDPDIFKQLQ